MNAEAEFPDPCDYIFWELPRELAQVTIQIPAEYERQPSVKPDPLRRMRQMACCAVIVILLAARQERKRKWERGRIYVPLETTETSPNVSHVYKLHEPEPRAESVPLYGSHYESAADKFMQTSFTTRTRWAYDHGLFPTP